MPAAGDLANSKMVRTPKSHSDAPGVPRSGIEQALERVTAFFRGRETRPGVLARRLLRQPKKDDPQLIEHLVRERRRRTRINGSMDGSLVATAWTAWELMDLECPPDHAAVVRTIGYVLAQQDKPGHFAEGCDSHRHARQLCHHFLRGFFSVGTADTTIAPASFPSGVTVHDEADARLAASCFALRAVLRAGEDRRPGVVEHLESLTQLLQEESGLGGEASPDLRFFAVGALALGPMAYRDRLDRLLATMLSSQNPAGGWSNASLFHALSMLLSVPTPPARAAIHRAAPLLCSMQHGSGAFDRSEDEEKALIGLRALMVADATTQ